MLILAALFGLILGSFLNVVIIRVPLEQSLITPPSHCPKCNNHIKWHMNVPVFSYIFLRGKCAYCKTPISIQYPLIELCTAVLFFVSIMRFGLTLEAGTVIFFVMTVFVISLIDIRHYIIPWEILIPAFLWKIAVSIYDHSVGMRIIAFFIPAVIIAAIMIIGKAIYKKDVMGGGDIYYSAFLGLYIGISSLMLFFILSFLSGALIGGILTLINKKRMRDTIIPFGPFLSLGAVICYFGGSAIIDWYTIQFLGGL